MTRAELAAAKLRPPAQTLTPRERQVAELVASGLPQSQIAIRLQSITRETVKAHISSVYRKLGISGHGAARELQLRRKEFGL